MSDREHYSSNRDGNGLILPHTGAEKAQKSQRSEMHLVVNSCLENQQTDRCGSGKQSLFEEELKTQHKMASKQHAIGTTLCEELQASNCIYKSQGTPARGIGPPPAWLGKLLTNIA